MGSNVEDHADDHQAQSITPSTEKDSIDTTKAQRSDGSSKVLSTAHDGKSEIQSYHHAIGIWLQQNPGTDPWSAVARLDEKQASTGGTKTADGHGKPQDSADISLEDSKNNRCLHYEDLQS